MSAISRRAFARKAGLGLAAIPLYHLTHPGPGNPDLEIHLFSKHLQFLSWEEAAEVAATLGFQGLDLTVRPGGHVAPDQVGDSLPRALEAIRRGGSHCRLITTAVEDAERPEDRLLLETASKVGVELYRSNWYRYDDHRPLLESLADFRQKLAALSRLNSRLNLIGSYQNHAGTGVGASIWELHSLLHPIEAAHFGVQYDIRHAVVEGGLSWENGLRLIRNQIKTIVLKDFKWGRRNGKWVPVNTPIGEGMVDFTKYFSLLKKYGIAVPAVLHLEYPLGGAEHGSSKLNVPQDIVFKSMKKDLQTVRDLWKRA